MRRSYRIAISPTPSPRLWDDTGIILSPAANDDNLTSTLPLLHLECAKARGCHIQCTHSVSTAFATSIPEPRGFPAL